MMDGGTVIFIVLSVVLGYLVWDTYFSNEVEYVTSSIDQKSYLVRSLPDKQEAANLLSQIREKLEKFVEHLQKQFKDDDRVKQIKENFRSDKISEGSESTKYTSYSINKGEKIVLCIRSKDEQKKLVDLNTMMFVVLHEIAHIGTKSIGHTPEFWDNFKWILKEAVNTGIYKSQDFNNKPVEYCGIQITDNPLNSDK
jgi:predicted metal-dependent hydrolase